MNRKNGKEKMESLNHDTVGKIWILKWGDEIIEKINAQLTPLTIA
jgi:hypothetical protein